MMFSSNDFRVLEIECNLASVARKRCIQANAEASSFKKTMHNDSLIQLFVFIQSMQMAYLFTLS